MRDREDVRLFFFYSSDGKVEGRTGKECQRGISRYTCRLGSRVEGRTGRERFSLFSLSFKYFSFVSSIAMNGQEL